MLLAGLGAIYLAFVGGAGSAAALDLATSIDLDYTYSQEDLGGDVNATTLFNQKYELKYETSLTSSYDFLGAVRLTLQDAWHTSEASTSQVAPTLELSAKGSQAAAKIAYEEIINSTDVYHEKGDVTNYSTSLAFDLEVTPALWPELRLKYQRRGDFQDYQKESIVNSLELSLRKDIYGVRLEYNFKRADTDQTLPARQGSSETQWSGKATYKEILWGGTEFELAYEINETYKDDNTRGVFTGDSQDYNQILRMRFRNSLVIAPRLTLDLSWDYEYEKDFLDLDFDYKLKNKYVLGLRWDAFDSLKFSGEARRETDLMVAVDGEDDERGVTDSIKGGFDLTSISWLQLSGTAELRSEGKIAAGTGGSVDNLDEEKYELIARNHFVDFWDFTWDATSSTKRTDGWLTSRETRVKGDLKLLLLGLAVTPGYEVSRLNEWEKGSDLPINQQQVRDARIKFDYQMQLTDMFKASFSHEYGIKVDDKLDEVLNFERVLQFNEDTRLNILVADIIRDLRLEGEIDRKASDTEDDPDPELIELSYSLKLDWKIQNLSISSAFKYNDKGNTFDDLSFNTKAGWSTDRLEVSGEYQFDKIIKRDPTEPKDEKRKINLKLNYKF